MPVTQPPLHPTLEQLLVPGDPTATRANLQACLEQTAAAGGGVVELPATTFELSNALHIPSQVHLRGQGEQTILRPWSGPSTALVRDVGYGMVELWLENPEGFEPGVGVVVGDHNAFGYYETAATILWRRGNRIGLDTPCVHDYRIRPHARVTAVSSVVLFVDVRQARVSHLRITGQSGRKVEINGCRGGGIFMLRADDIHVHDLVVDGFGGEGISYQACRRTVIERVRTENNTGNGLHPGSGSYSFVMREIVSRNNGHCGVFYCMNLRYGLMEDGVIEKNAGPGISIGDLDTDQLIRRCTVTGNGGEGMIWRDDEGTADRVSLIDCRFAGNATTMTGNRAELSLPVAAEDLYLSGCRIEPAQDGAALHTAHARTRVVVAGGKGLDASHPAVQESPVLLERETPTWLERVPEDTDWHLPHRDGLVD